MAVSYLHARSKGKTRFALAPFEASGEGRGSVTGWTWADITTVNRPFSCG